jgi:HEAT repeat protein
MRLSIFKFAAGGGVALMLVLASYSAWPFAAQQTQSSARQYATQPAQASQAPPAAPPAASPAAISPAAARGDAWKVLNDGLAEKDYDRRASAISALGTIGVRPDAVKLVESGLYDQTPTVREVAAITLGRMKSLGSIPKLRAALDDDSPVVVYAAATALWQLNDKSGEEILAEILQGDRKASLGRVGEGLHKAHEKLHDPSALAELGVELTAGGFFAPAGWGVTTVIELSKDKSATVRAASALLLGDSIDADSRETLKNALSDNSWVVRAAAAQAIARHGTQREIAILAPLLKDDHAEVRYEAAAAIVRLAPRG